MSFLRPEAIAALRRWRETGVAALVALLGLWWALTGLGFVRLFGVILLVTGAALGWAAVQRARFRGGEGGVGAVEVDEGQITYLAPFGGGFAARAALTEVAIVPGGDGAPLWRFRSGMELLTVPAAAAGTEALFDVITALPGADLEAAIRASAGRVSQMVVIWRASGPH